MDIRDIQQLSRQFSSVETPAERFGKRWVAVIGIDSYPVIETDKVSVRPLDTAVNDAKAVMDVLVDLYGYKPLIKPLLNEDATRGGFEKLFIELQNTDKIKPEDQVILYYAGHGQEAHHGSEGFWIPHLTEKIHYHYSYRWIAHSTIKHTLLDCPARQVLLVSDSCYSMKLTEKLADRDLSQAGRNDMDSDFMKFVCSSNVRAVLSSGSREPVLDMGRGGHSVFCNHFLDLLERYPSKCLPLEGVTYAHVCHAVVESSKNLGQKQTPRLGYLTDDTLPFLLFKKGITNQPKPESPEIVIEDFVLCGSLVVTCNVGGADITIGSTAFKSQKGSGWILKNLPVGFYSVSASKPEYKGFHARVEVEEDTKAVLRIKLEKTAAKKSREVKRDGNYILFENGVVLDTGTNFEWVAGPDRDTDWNQAKKWVEGLDIAGGGWRMPTRKELKGLYQEGKGSRNMTPLLKTTRYWVWSGEIKGSSSAWNFFFFFGEEFWRSRDDSGIYRAFAVRFRR